MLTVEFTVGASECLQRSFAPCLIEHSGGTSMGSANRLGRINNVLLAFPVTAALLYFGKRYVEYPSKRVSSNLENAA